MGLLRVLGTHLTEPRFVKEPAPFVGRGATHQLDEGCLGIFGISQPRKASGLRVWV